MQVLLYIFPFVLLIFVLTGFFVELANPKGKIILALVALLSFPIAGMSAYLAKKSQDEIAAGLVEAESIGAWKQSIIARLASLLSSKRSEVLSEQEKISAYAQYGWTSKHPLFNQSELADTERTKLMEVITPPNNAVTIENLPGTVDKMIVSWSLEELGYRVSGEQKQDFLNANDSGQTEDEETTEKEPDSETDPSQIMPANTMFYGHRIRNHDIKLIVYTLIRAGVQLKMLRPFKSKTAENSRSVRFEWSKNYSKRETITVEKIIKQKRFKR